jgi:Domain of unknown function (DUF4410)
MRDGRPSAFCALRIIGGLALLLTLAACGPSKVEPLDTYRGAALPRPDLVIVSDFVAAPDAVTLDRGLGARLRSAISGSSAAARQSEDERKVAAAIAKTLVREIRTLGLAVLQSNEVAATGTNKLVVAGQILTINEGNRTRRTLIGLGAGRSTVAARADVYYAAGGAEPSLVESFKADAESGRKPGAAETMGVGAAAGTVAESAAVTVGTNVAPALSGDVSGDGERMAKAIAKQMAKFFVAQGWIPASAAR